MFYVMVRASHGGLVDARRAEWLMDGGLLTDAEAWAIRNCNNRVIAQRDREAGVSGWCQAIWAAYCQMHHRKYGAPFRPDVDAKWA